MPRTPDSTSQRRFHTLVATCVTVAALYLAQDALKPVALAVLISFLLTPLCVRLERMRLGRVMSVLVVTFAMAAVVGVLSWVVAGQVINLANQLPGYTGTIIEKLDALHPGKAGVFAKLASVQKKVEEQK